MKVGLKTINNLLDFNIGEGGTIMSLRVRILILISTISLIFVLGNLYYPVSSAQQNQDISLFQSTTDGFEVQLPSGWLAVNFQHSYVFYSPDLTYELSSLVQGSAIYVIVYPITQELPSNTVIKMGNDRIYTFSCESIEPSNCPYLLQTFIETFTLTSNYQEYTQLKDVNLTSSFQLKMPFDGSQSTPWKIVQGYRTGTHDSYDQLALDLTIQSDLPPYVNSETEKEPGLAPIPGDIAWGGFPEEAQGCISIKTDIPELGGKDVVRTLVCHILYDIDFRKVGSVVQGQALGYIAPGNPPQKGNNGVPHIHINLYRLGTPSNENAVRIPIAFDGFGSLGTYSFPDNGINSAWTGYSPLYSTNYGFCPALKTTTLKSQSGYCTYDNTPVDVYLLVDLSSSFYDDLPVFKAQAPAIISNLKASYTDIQFGLGRFEDYPISPFGSSAYGDKAYQRVVDLTTESNQVLTAISGLYVRYGNDTPESQYPALYQTATGKGQDLSSLGYSWASIPAGQQASFRSDASKLILLWTDASFHRPGDPGSIAYPGPSYDETVNAIKKLGNAKVVGVLSTGLVGTSYSASNTDNPQQTMEVGIMSAFSDVSSIAAATGAVAGQEGVDCNNDGRIDILPGEPLVCSISTSGQGISEAIIALVDAATKVQKVYLPVILR